MGTAALALACSSGSAQEPLASPSAPSVLSSDGAPTAAAPEPDHDAEAPLLASRESASTKRHSSPQPQASAEAPDISAQAQLRAPASSTVKAGRQLVGKDAPPGLLDFVGDLREAGDQGTLWLGKLSGNGDREVLIYIPAGTDPEGDFRLIYHFHGTYSEHVERRAEGLKKRVWVGWDRLQQTVDGAAALQAQGPHNIALIYPLSAGKRMEPEWEGWSNKAYDRMWMQPGPKGFSDSFAQLDAEVAELLTGKLGVHPSRMPAQVTAEGHSAGGIALWNIARHDDGRVADYLFLDAGFHLWADGCFAEIQAHKRPRDRRSRVVLVIRDGGIADPVAGPNAWCVDHPAFVDAWPTVAETCTADPKAKPKSAPGRGKVRCDEWRSIAEGWPAVEAWCQGMADDMRDVDGVVVHRTKVPHGDQPRAFFGGLGIPEMRPDAGS